MIFVSLFSLRLKEHHTQRFTDLKWPFKFQFSTHVHWSCHSTLDPPHPIVSQRVYSCAVPSAWSAPSSTASSLVFHTADAQPLPEFSLAVTSSARPLPVSHTKLGPCAVVPTV